MNAKIFFFRFFLYGIKKIIFFKLKWQVILNDKIFIRNCVKNFSLFFKKDPIKKKIQNFLKIEKIKIIKIFFSNPKYISIR